MAGAGGVAGRKEGGRHGDPEGLEGLVQELGLEPGNFNLRKCLFSGHVENPGKKESGSMSH